MQIAIVDIDGVVADSTARADKAHDIAMQKLRERPQDFSEVVLPMDNLDKLKRTDAYKKAFFDSDAFYHPELVAMDVMIGDANMHVQDLRGTYTIAYVTSRPESLRPVTRAWLWENDLIAPVERLVMKSGAFQYTKTKVWKAGIIQTLVTLYENVTGVLVIEDEQANADEINSTWPFTDIPLKMFGGGR